MDCMSMGWQSWTQLSDFHFTSPLDIGVPSSGSSYNSLRSILNAKIQRQH